MCFFTFVTSQFFAKAYIVVGIDKYVKDKVLKKKNFFFLRTLSLIYLLILIFHSG